jgi:hypothetical protein
MKNRPRKCVGMQKGIMVLCGKPATRKVARRWYCEGCYEKTMAGRKRIEERIKLP